jgi:hypothetical protein
MQWLFKSREVFNVCYSVSNSRITPPHLALFTSLSNHGGRERPPSKVKLGLSIPRDWYSYVSSLKDYAILAFDRALSGGRGFGGRLLERAGSEWTDWKLRSKESPILLHVFPLEGDQVSRCRWHPSPECLWLQAPSPTLFLGHLTCNRGTIDTKGVCPCQSL